MSTCVAFRVRTCRSQRAVIAAVAIPAPTASAIQGLEIIPRAQLSSSAFKPCVVGLTVRLAQLRDRLLELLGELGGSLPRRLLALDVQGVADDDRHLREADPVRAR